MMTVTYSFRILYLVLVTSFCAGFEQCDEDIKIKIICERPQSGPQNLQCLDKSLIYIEYGNWGRTVPEDETNCEKSIIDNPSTNCISGRDKINDTCKEKQKCTLTPSNKFFGGDPCYGTVKYINATYSCLCTDQCLPEYCEFGKCENYEYRCNACHNITGGQDAYHLSDGECLAKCNWLGHWCFPGKCDKDNNYLHSSCNCTDGFKKITPNKETTKCVLTHDPDIITCRLGAESPLGEVANTTFKDNSNSCQSTEDAYVNFEIGHMFFEYSFSFELPEDPPNGDDLHEYVNTYQFGVIDASDTISHYSYTGTETVLDVIDSDTYPNDFKLCSYNATETFNKDNPLSGMLITCNASMNYGNLSDLKDGEKVCHRFNVKASGYVDITDMANGNNTVRHYYDTTKSTREVCFHIDYTSPDHCANTQSMPCDNDVLNVGNRIRQDKELNVTFHGWYDPEPVGNVSSASGMKEYEIEIRDVMYTPTELYADFKSFATYISHGVLNITLPNREEPSMYAIYIWALDSTQESPNYRIARRFVLSDNTSEVDTHSDHPIYVTSASSKTNLEWQVHTSPIKLDWKKHFYNSWHVHTNLLLPIRGDGNLSISGVFEQETGELPVTGTPNLDGIVNFMYKYSRISVEGKSTSAFANVTNPDKETLTVSDFQPIDGDLVDIYIKAIDIMNNTLDDMVTVKIDSTNPLIKDMYLMKDGARQLFVHNSTDLSEMNMTFSAYDPHSGMKTVFWKLGTEVGKSDIGSGALPVVKIKDNDTCSDFCYCPMIGECQQYTYVIPLVGLIANNTDTGDHNREYHFTVKVMNDAHLEMEEQVTILVDSTPPEQGHVFDGPPGSRDRDFQSDPLLLWHWEGFIDHESGISRYHAAIGEICFSMEELQFLSNNSTDMYYFGLKLQPYSEYMVKHPGYYRMTVIAFNGAMQPSEAVCSSGIVYDITPPLTKSISLVGSIHQKSILCSFHGIWFIYSDGIIQLLSDVIACTQKCHNQAYFDIEKFPQRLLQNGTVSQTISLEESTHFCKLFPLYSKEQHIFLPNDNIHLNWNVTENESQMQDSYVGIASNIQAIERPDIVSFKSTHNKTDHKCMHCGMGQGETVYISLKSLNKASLFEIEPIGPVIIDMTPPKYYGGMNISYTDNEVVLSWKFDSFIDEDDESVLNEYDWSLGTRSKPQVVMPWRRKIFPFDYSLSSHRFEISVLKGDIQKYDQDQGLTYVFTIKAYNKGLLYTTTVSEEFQIHSHVLPTTGIVIHVNSDKAIGQQDEIGFQERNDKLCITWFGFDHYLEQPTFSIGIGIWPYTDNIKPSFPTIEQESICIDNLSLETGVMYYATVTASNLQGYVNATSKGIYMSSEDDILHNASLITGSLCPSEFQYILDGTLTRTKSDYMQISYNPTIPMTSQPYMTLRLKVVGSDIILNHLVTVIHNSITLNLDTWKNKGNTIWFYYTFIQMDINFIISINHFKNITLNEVAIHKCVENIDYIPSRSLTIETFLTYPHSLHVSNYEISIQKHSSNNTNDLLVDVGDHSSNIVQVDLEQGVSYRACVRPCFKMTCISKQLCKTLVTNCKGFIGGRISSTLDKTGDTVTDSNIYEISATWDLFLQESDNGSESLNLYDWTLATDKFGSSPVTEWQRILVENGVQEAQIKEHRYLHVYKHKDLYFVLRGISKAQLLTIHAAKIVLKDLMPNSGVEVFDLPSCYNIDELREYLHASNLGKQMSILHNDDIDFTSDTAGISGAILGCDCGKYIWSLQTDQTLKCVDQVSGHNGCVASKETSDNIVKFTMQRFKYAVNYTLCVTGQGRCLDFFKCSNGFVLDEKPPLPGKVQLGIDATKTYSPDSSSIYVSWTDFRDIEEDITIPYSNGIKEYTVALGSAPGEVDILAYINYGMSDHVYFTNLTLVSGRNYYATVKACDHVNLCSEVSSNRMLIDVTPPTVESIELIQENLFATGNLVVKWNNIDDPETGILNIEVAVGTTSLDKDVFPYQSVFGSNIYIINSNLLRDGQIYYSHVKAINTVGLWTLKSSEPVLYDSSPPLTGYVRHGLPGESPYVFIRDDSKIKFHWDGFSDSHSGIFFYRVAVGMYVDSDDLISFKDVGTQTEFQADVHLKHGQQYYVTVEACNGVLLCSRAFSSALVADNSNPVPGIIHIGFSEEHEPYQYNKQSLSIKWIGFNDPESGINNYQWCISTFNGSCDIYPLTNAHTATHINPSSLNLLLNTELYITVIATNNVHLQTSIQSKVFYVDVTEPLVISKPKITTYSSLKPNTQFDRSYISLNWEMADNETPMIFYVVSIISHHDGVTPIPGYKLGNVNNATIPLALNQQLRDGNMYTIKVTGCNAASLCTTSAADDILVDSSPAFIGGFIEPMFWRKEQHGTVLTLAWKEFVDPHSNIMNYYLMIGSTYNGGDLSDGIKILSHNKRLEIQQAEVLLQDKDINLDQLIYLTIWAENGVGLLTDAAKISVFVLPQNKPTDKEKHGVLEIQKHSCDIHYCNNDCTCAIFGGYCVPKGVNYKCHERNDTYTSQLRIYDGLYQKNQVITPSSVCLQGYWMSNFTNQVISRYEWSVSMKGHNPGFGVIDITNEKYLFDVELYDRAVFCLKGNATLLQGEKYGYHVYSWHNFNEYSSFESDGVLVDTTPPQIRMGRHVLNMNANFSQEVYFTADVSGVYSTWENVFFDIESGIAFYIVSIGIRQGGDDIFGPVNVGLATNLSYTKTQLQPGFKYYTTVHASNTLGMYATAYSSGFIIDIKPPYHGIAFTGRNFHDNKYKDGNDFKVSWNSFADTHSYIKEYLYSIDKDYTPKNQLTFTSNYLKNEVLIKESLEHNTDYRLFVKAVDAAGHKSDIVKSSIFTIDKTAPLILQCTSRDSLFFSSQFQFMCETVNDYHKLMHCLGTVNVSLSIEKGLLYEVMILMKQDPGKMKAKFEFGNQIDWVTFERRNWNNFVYKGYFVLQDDDMVSPKIFISQNVAEAFTINIHKCKTNEISYCTSCNNNVKQWSKHIIKVNLPIYDPESGVNDVQIGIGSNPGGFQLMTMTSFGSDLLFTSVFKLQHNMTIYVKFVATNKAGIAMNHTFAPYTVDWTPPILDNINVIIQPNSHENEVTISANWDVTEPESEMSDCLWAIGYEPKSTDVLEWRETDHLSSSKASKLNLDHGDIVYVTVRCYNIHNLYREAISKSTTITFASPDADRASIEVYLKHETFNQPRDNTQSSDSCINFKYNGFSDITGIHYFEYQITELGSWVNASKQDFLSLENIDLKPGSENIIAVRSTNFDGMKSDSVETSIKINKGVPELTGKSLGWHFEGQKLTISWSEIFQWNNQHGNLLYEIYLGTSEGSSDVEKGHITPNMEMTITSKKFIQPFTCYCVITAIAPSGTYQIHVENINV